MEYRLKADGCLNFREAMTLIKSLVELAIPEVTFMSAYAKGTEPDLNRNPVITYKVIRRQPADKEIKMRPREFLSDGENGIQIYGQRFDYQVEFAIWGSTNDEVDEVLDKFEDMINIYRGNLMKSGIQQIIFMEQLNDDPDEWKKKLICRPLHYLIRFERLTIIKGPLLKVVTVRTGQGLTFEILNEEE